MRIVAMALLSTGSKIYRRTKKRGRYLKFLVAGCGEEKSREFFFLEEEEEEEETSVPVGSAAVGLSTRSAQDDCTERR